MIKLSVNETKWSSSLARTRALIFYISIWIFDFGPEKLPGSSRNGPQADQSRPPSKLAPNIPVGSNQNGPYHLMYVPTEIYGISQGYVPLGWSGSGLVIGDHSDHGRSRLFTIYKNFPGIRLESKWNTTFYVVPTENFREQQNICKS